MKNPEYPNTLRVEILITVLVEENIEERGSSSYDFNYNVKNVMVSVNKLSNTITAMNCTAKCAMFSAAHSSEANVAASVVVAVNMTFSVNRLNII